MNKIIFAQTESMSSTCKRTSFLNERIHPHFDGIHEKSKFFVKTENWHPSKFFSGALGLIFVYTGHKNKAKSFLLSILAFHSVQCFEILSEMVSTQAKKNCIIAKHMYTRPFEFLFVQDCSFVVVLILDHGRPVWSGCEMNCFCCITRTTVIDSVHGHNFE